MIGLLAAPSATVREQAALCLAALTVELEEKQAPHAPHATNAACYDSTHHDWWPAG